MESWRFLPALILSSRVPMSYCRGIAELTFYALLTRFLILWYPL